MSDNKIASSVANKLTGSEIDMVYSIGDLLIDLGKIDAISTRLTPQFGQSTGTLSSYYLEIYLGGKKLKISVTSDRERQSLTDAWLTFRRFECGV